MSESDRNHAADATQWTASTRRLTARLLGRSRFLHRPGAVRGLGARRWPAWAHALVARHAGGPSRGARAALVFAHRATATASFATRIVERTLAQTTLVAPQLHLTIAPLLRLGAPAGAPASFAP